MSDNGWMKIKRSTAVDIADALREKKGSADLIDPADFPAVIRGMSGKLPSVIDKTVTELTFEDFGNATKIGYIVFRECKNLTRVEIPKGITSIEGNAFMSCSKLAEVIFEEGSTLASIASQAFSGAQMTSLILPCSVTSMNGALYSCSKLASVSLPLACVSFPIYLRMLYYKASYISIYFIAELFQEKSVCIIFRISFMRLSSLFHSVIAAALLSPSSKEL